MFRHADTLGEAGHHTALVIRGNQALHSSSQTILCALIILCVLQKQLHKAGAKGRAAEAAELQRRVEEEAPRHLPTTAALVDAVLDDSSPEERAAVTELLASNRVDVHVLSCLESNQEAMDILHFVAVGHRIRLRNGAIAAKAAARKHARDELATGGGAGDRQ